MQRKKMLKLELKHFYFKYWKETIRIYYILFHFILRIVNFVKDILCVMQMMKDILPLISHSACTSLKIDLFIQFLIEIVELNFH